MSNKSNLHFIPWVLSGLAASSSDPAAAGERRFIHVAPTVQKQSGEPYGSPPTANSDFLLKAAHDVIGFHSDCIARTEPRDGTHDFEPNYFTFIEFKDFDFPWRYSLDVDATDKRKPWLTLIVLQKNEFQNGPKSGVQVPTIRISKDLLSKTLPDLSQSWAWVHAQVMGAFPEDRNLTQQAAEHSELNCSRLICPRRLQPQTAYDAFIVPATDIGRRAALGETVETVTGDAAWTTTTSEDPFRLPYYFHWSFTTSERGDVEELMSRIQPRQIPTPDPSSTTDVMGTRTVDGSQPGFVDWSAQTGKDNVLLEGALIPPRFGDKRAPTLPSGFPSAVCPSLNLGLHEDSLFKENAANDPLLTIPVYGRAYCKVDKISLPGSKGQFSGSQPWIHEASLDRRARVAASFGVSTVHNQRETYMAECWEQAGAVRAANELLAKAALARTNAASIKAKHLDRLDPERFAMVTRPFHHYYARSDKGSGITYRAFFDQSGLVQGILSPTFRRISAAKTGPATTGVLTPWTQGNANRSVWRILLRILLFLFRILIEFIIKGIVNPVYLQPLINGIRNLANRIQPVGRQRILVVALKVLLFLLTLGPRAKRILPTLQYLLYLCKVPMPGEKPRWPDPVQPLGDDLKQDLGITAALQPVMPLRAEIVNVQPIDINRDLRPQFDMSADLVNRLSGMISLADKKALINDCPIHPAPKIDTPLYADLIKRSIEELVPGLSRLENNSVTLMEENRKFIEAFLLGTNHEMGRVMLFREFPADPRGTVFRYFWDPPLMPSPPPDILDIDQWRSQLGLHAAGGNRPQANLTLVVKADLIRRYPEIIIYALKKRKRPSVSWGYLFEQIDGFTDKVRARPDGGVDAVDGSFSTIPAVYSAWVGIDTLFLGFPFTHDDTKRGDQDYYFIFAEHPSLPRFGLDESRAPGLSLRTWDDLAWSDMTTDAAGYISPSSTPATTPSALNPADPARWGGTSAALAWILNQKPARLTVPAAMLLEPQ